MCYIYSISDFSLSLSLQIIEALVSSLVSQVGPERGDPEAVKACQHFIRSVLRILVVCEMEKTGTAEISVNTLASRKKP